MSNPIISGATDVRLFGIIGIFISWPSYTFPCYPYLNLPYRALQNHALHNHALYYRTISKRMHSAGHDSEHNCCAFLVKDTVF